MRDYVRKFIESVKAHSTLPLVQLTDYKTEAIESCEIVRADYGDPHHWMLYKVLHMRDYACHEKVILDTDILVKSDFQEVFDEDFDVAMHRRTKSLCDSAYNGGVVFTKGSQFWDDCAERILSFDSKYHHWDGDQMAENRAIFSGRHKVYDLPEKYNYVPHQLRRGAVNKLPKEGVAIMHFKGPLKEYM